MSIRKDNIEDFITSLAKIINTYGSKSYTAAEGIEYIIDNNLWQERDPSPGLLENRSFRNFQEFCAAPTPWGLNTHFQVILDLCHREPKILHKVTEAGKMKHGGDRKSNNIKNDNIILETEQGTSKSYGLQRLHNERPDLYELVIEKEMSVNAAMVKAGLRPKTYTVREDADDFIRKIKQVFDQKTIDYIVLNLLK